MYVMWQKTVFQMRAVSFLSVLTLNNDTIVKLL